MLRCRTRRYERYMSDADMEEKRRARCYSRYDARSARYAECEARRQ